MLRRVLMVAAITLGGVAAFVALSFPVAVHMQNRALDNCSARPDPHPGGTATVHWKSLLPPRYVCAYDGRDFPPPH
jgi:hypothetical protein